MFYTAFVPNNSSRATVKNPISDRGAFERQDSIFARKQIFYCFIFGEGGEDHKVREAIVVPKRHGIAFRNIGI